MRKYEVMVIFDVDDDTLENAKDFVNKCFSGNQVNIIDEKDIGQKKLAYPINDKDRGHYYLYNIETEQKNLVQVEKAFKLYKNIIRYVIVRKN